MPYIQFAKLARDLTFPGGISTSKSAAVTDSDNLPVEGNGDEEEEKEVAPTRSHIVEEDELPPELC